MVLTSPSTVFGPVTVCPLCGGAVEKLVTTVETPVLTGYGKLTRTKSLGTVVACTACEWAEVKS